MESSFLRVVVMLSMVSARMCRGSSVDHKQLSACTTEIINSTTKQNAVINLEPLARKDGLPRYTAVFNFTGHPWNYSFNPCEAFDLPADNPHQGYGDGCHSVSVCKYTEQFNHLHFFTMGIHSSAKFHVWNNSSADPTVELIYSGIKSMRSRNFIISLICDVTKTGIDDGIFSIVSDSGKGSLYAELRHECCCPGGCWNAGLGLVVTSPDRADSNFTGPSNGSHLQDGKTARNEKGEMMLMLIGLLVAVVMLAGLIGGLCFIKTTHLQMYAKLPTVAKTHGRGHAMPLGVKTDLRDYEPAAVARKKQLPVLQDTMINQDSLEMCQRLGGGIFGDTHLAKWHEMTVAVKRLTLLVHENQITPEAIKLMKNEVWFLSRQRHKNIVTILGLCLNGKLPSIITEYVIGECLKDFIKVQGRLLSWPHRVRMCLQVADGMAFLHSAKPPIIHRDLRCGNLFLSDNDVVKVADFGLIKLLQPVREECPQDDCCCRRTQSACPASIRWTAPELLAHPVTKEGITPVAQKSNRQMAKSACDGDGSGDADGGRGGVGRGGEGGEVEEQVGVISPACDVFSFGLVMWELPMCQDPFEEIVSETEVIEIVKNGGRPETPPSADMMPQYKELMKLCWDQLPASRPTFKQVVTRLKDLGSQARSYQKHLQNQQRVRKLQQNNLPV